MSIQRIVEVCITYLLTVWLHLLMASMAVVKIDRLPYARATSLPKKTWAPFHISIKDSFCCCSSNIFNPVSSTFLASLYCKNSTPLLRSSRFYLVIAGSV